MRQHFFTIVLLVFTNQAVFSQSCNDRITPQTPDSRFIVKEQEVTDTKTGLIWQKCLLGQGGEDCSTGDAGFFSWKQALQASQTYALQTDKAWRLPNIKELGSIVERQCADPAINVAIFPNAPPSPIESLYLWSASPYNYFTTFGYVISLMDGIVDTRHKYEPHLVRLVRTGQ